MVAWSRATVPYGGAVAALAVVVTLTSVRAGRVPWPVLAGIGVAVPFQWAITRGVLGRSMRFPYSAIVTGALIGCVLPLTSTVWVAASATAVGLLTKTLLRTGPAPVFNPAAAGLVVPLLVLGIPGNTWGGPAPAIPWGMVLVPVLCGLAWATRRLALLVTFGAAYLIPAVAFSGLAPGFSLAWATTLLATGYFAVGGLMVIDPRTSPAAGPVQAVYGAGLGVGTFAVSALGAAAPFLWALLGANGLLAIWRSRGRGVLRRPGDREGTPSEGSARDVRALPEVAPNATVAASSA